MLPPDFKLVRSGGIVEPLSLPDAKNFLRNTPPEDDTLIQSYITAARRKCEQLANASLVPSTWTLTADYLPWNGAAGYWNYWQAACGDLFSASVIELPNPPLTAVQSINYVGMDGIVHLLAPSAYRVSLGNPGQIQPVYGTNWPFLLPEIAAIQIVYSAGISPDDLATVQAAMRLMVGLYYTYRSDDVTIPSQIAYILDPVRNYG